jgi:hypothetical protein
MGDLLMTYIPPRENKLEIALLNWTVGSINTSATLTLNGSSWANAPVISGGNTLVLSPGHYRFCAAVGLTRAVASYNVQFGIYADGALIGVLGQSDLYLNGGNVDLADAVLSIPEGQTVSISVRVPAYEIGFPTIVAEDSTLVVWRTSL